jgi:uncharacterized membrane protein
MIWIYWALIPPVLYALSNLIDKIIIEKYISTGSLGGLFIVSSLVAIISVALIVLCAPVNFANVTGLQALLLILQGAFIMLYLIPYFKALQQDDPAMVTALFQFIPVLCLLLEFVFLGTLISGQELTGIFVVIFGAFAISLAYTDKKIVPKTKTFGLIFLSSLIIALGLVLFKGVGKDLDFWAIACYSSIGSVIPGLVALCFYKKYRRDFIELLYNKPRQFYFWNLINELVVLVAGLVYYYCITTLAAPIALVSAMSGMQPALVFVIGVTLSLLFPKLYREQITVGTFFYKVVCIAMITAGVILIALK